jgi:enamine deaminase RidA (YjgF/YER057c/UK114 family)/catechol 2,3-dioxygenase-like lactoylglutathione lyase family enzyme
MMRRLIGSGSPFEAEVGYSRAVVDGDWIFVSGTTGFDYRAMTIEGDVAAQAAQCLKNIEAALKEAGADLRDVVRVNYILPDAAEFKLCWPVLRQHFGETRPAATMISAGLMDPRMKIEIEVTARRPAGKSLPQTPGSGERQWSHIAPVFRVRDLPRSLAFYRDKLGFAVEFEYENFYASVVRDCCHIHLKCAPQTPRDQAEFERNGHIDTCIVVNDARALYETITAAQVPLSVALREAPYGKEFYVRDTDGYILGFVEPRRD